MKRWVRKNLLGLLVLAFLLYMVWALFLPHTDASDGPVSMGEADDCPIPLPPSAKNIQWFTYSHWIESCEFVRFEAPPEDCLAHIPAVIAAWREDFDEETYPDPQPTEPIELPIHDGATIHFDVSWFGLDQISEGIVRYGSSGVPTIWVDTARGVFYYQLTD